MDWAGRKILVTGGAGLIGSTLVENLVERGAIVTVADNLWRGKRENLIVNGHGIIDFDKDFYQVDLIDYYNCSKVVKGQEIVYHLADVVAGINYVFGNQLSLFHTNVVMNSNMLHAAIAAGVQKYIYVGTACSYPADKQSILNPPPFKEENAYPASPESSYGWSKLMGEYECEIAAEEGLVEVGILRLHNVYGPKSDMSPEKSQVIPSLIRKAINYPQEDFVVWGSGNQRRAFVYIYDVITSLLSVVERGMGKGVIQIGPDYSISIREIAETIAAISGKDIDIKYDPAKREGDMDRVADWSKAKRILGWSPKTTIETGLKKTYEWCQQHLNTNHGLKRKWIHKIK
jgi:nucleoside-diphosphate-sugar epimerase